MDVPINIKREHIIKALDKIDKEGVPKNAASRFYDLKFNDRLYPPKVVISFANYFANGSELDRNTFSGGENKSSFKILENEGFKLVRKKELPRNEFHNTIIEFLEQAHSPTLNLKTIQYRKEYKELSVKVSFGQGNLAKIPWIALLAEGQKVSDGIYPVYLYFKEIGVLILAYGISETKKPNISWNIKTKTVNDVLENTFNVIPDRYGDSLLFSYYKIDPNEKHFGVNFQKIDDDIDDLISVYINLISKMPVQIAKKINHKDFENDLKKSGLQLDTNKIVRFIASLLTKPFVILTGLSGSGKTKLAQAFAIWLCEDESQYCIVPVGADWTNREPLLGFPNALKAGEYIKPENGVLDLIINANAYPDKPYFLILDEMNLSHVERYFADFLSVMESKGKLSLHTGKDTWSDVPHEVSFPKNLFIIGTVNIDETTYMFSPKVLDRANVIEFRVTAEEMGSYLNSDIPLDMDLLISAGAGMGNSFVTMGADNSLVPRDADEIKQSLIRFFNELKITGAEFGYRTASEILRFVSVINHIDPNWTTIEIIDAAILQKLLPKVHGSRKRLEPVLRKLGELCLNETKDFDEVLKSQTETVFSEKGKYPLSLEKIIRMYKSLIFNGFTSYAEA